MPRQRHAVLDSMLGAEHQSHVAEWPTETFTYDDRQRQTLHVSFEGVYKQTLYDDSAVGGGRMVGYNLFASQADYLSYTGGGARGWHSGLGTDSHELRCFWTRNLD